jgi:hypothetical protein
MVTTVDGGFRDFLSRLTPLGGESNAAKKHRKSIQDCLSGNFGLHRFFRSGSFGNGTSIRRYSDVDYFASIHSDSVPDSSTWFLTKVRNALDERFPNTGVHVSTPAVVVPFGTDGCETTEVVPAKYVGKTDADHAIYKIADGSGGWMKASPEAHGAYVKAVDSELGGKVRPLVRFLKAWKYFRNVDLCSFYLELRCAKYASGESTIVYSVDVRRVLKLLWDNQLAAMHDPQGVSGYVYACSTDAKKEAALSKLETALYRANKAWEAESDEDIEEAFRQWNLVFNAKFPAYG